MEEAVRSTVVDLPRHIPMPCGGPAVCIPSLYEVLLHTVNADFFTEIKV